MKHLKFTQDMPASNIALEGFVDTVGERISEFKKRLFSHGKSSVELSDLSTGNQLSAELRAALAKAKSQIGSAKEQTFTADVGPALGLLGLNPTSAADLIQKLKHLEVEVNKAIEDERKNVDKASQDPTAAKKALETNQHITEQVEQPEEGVAAEPLTFTKREAIELVSVALDYLQSYEHQQKRVTAIMTSHEAQAGVANEGFLESFFHALFATIAGCAIYLLRVAFAVVIALCYINLPFTAFLLAFAGSSILYHIGHRMIVNAKRRAQYHNKKNAEEKNYKGYHEDNTGKV